MLCTLNNGHDLHSLLGRFSIKESLNTQNKSIIYYSTVSIVIISLSRLSGTDVKHIPAQSQ